MLSVVKQRLNSMSAFKHMVETAFSMHHGCIRYRNKTLTLYDFHAYGTLLVSSGLTLFAALTTQLFHSLLKVIRSYIYTLCLS